MLMISLCGEQMRDSSANCCSGGLQIVPEKKKLDCVFLGSDCRSVLVNVDAVGRSLCC